MITLGFVPKDVKIFDNQGEDKGGTHDRYTVIFPDGAVYTMNGFPFNEDGYCKYLQQGYTPTKQDIERHKVPTQVIAKTYQLMT